MTNITEQFLKIVYKVSMKLKNIVKTAGIPVLISSLCCLGPLILVVFGLGTVSFAASLSDTLYGQYRWGFRIVGLLLLGGSLFIYFRKRGICTLDKAKKRKNEVINTILIVLIAGIVAYILWLYVIVHYLGVWFGVWA